MYDHAGREIQPHYSHRQGLVIDRSQEVPEDQPAGEKPTADAKAKPKA